jgi:hypothetical protein
MVFIAVISFAPSSLQLNLRVVIPSQKIVIGVVVMHMLNFLHLERKGLGILIETLVGDMTPGSKKAISLIVKTNSTPNFQEHKFLPIR